MENNIYQSVIDPDTGFSYRINSKKGQKILKKYNSIMEQDAGFFGMFGKKKKKKKKKSSFFKRNKIKLGLAAAGMGMGLAALRKFSRKKKGKKKGKSQGETEKDTQIKNLQDQLEKKDDEIENLERKVKKLSPLQSFTKKISGKVNYLGKKVGIIKEKKKHVAKKTNLMLEKENLEKDEKELKEKKHILDKEKEKIQNKKNECEGVIGDEKKKGNKEIEELQKEIENTEKVIEQGEKKIIEEKEKIMELDFNIDDFDDTEKDVIESKKNDEKRKEKEKEKEKENTIKISGIKSKLVEKNGIIENLVKNNKIINNKIITNKKNLEKLEIKKKNIVSSFGDYEMSGGSGNEHKDSTETPEHNTSGINKGSKLHSEARLFLEKIWKQRDDIKDINTNYLFDVVKFTKKKIYAEIFPRINIAFKINSNEKFKDKTKKIVEELNSNFQKYNFKFYWISIIEKKISSEDNEKNVICELGIFNGDYHNKEQMSEILDFVKSNFKDENKYIKIKTLKKIREKGRIKEIIEEYRDVVKFEISNFCKKFLVPNNLSAIKWFFLQSPFSKLTKNEKETIIYYFYDYFPFLKDESFGFVLEDKNKNIDESNVHEKINEIYQVYLKLIKKPGWSKFEKDSNKIKKINQGYIKKDEDIESKKILLYDEIDSKKDIYLDFRIFLANNLLFNEFKILNIDKDKNIEKNTILYQLFSKNINIRKSVMIFLTLPSIENLVFTKESIDFIRNKIFKIDNYFKQLSDDFYQIFLKKDIDLITEDLKKIEKNLEDETKNRERMFYIGRILNIINNSLVFKSGKALISNPELNPEYLEKTNVKVTDLCKIRDDYLDQQKKNLNKDISDFAFFKEPSENVRNTIFKSIDIEKRKNNYIKSSCSDDRTEGRKYFLLYYFECIDSSNNNMFTKIMEHDQITIEMGRLIPFCCNFNIINNLEHMFEDFTIKLKEYKKNNTPLKIFGLEILPIIMILLDKKNYTNIFLKKMAKGAGKVAKVGQAVADAVNAVNAVALNAFQNLVEKWDLVCNYFKAGNQGNDSVGGGLTGAFPWLPDLSNWITNNFSTFENLDLHKLILENLKRFINVMGEDGLLVPFDFKQLDIFKDKDIEKILLIDKDDNKNLQYDLNKLKNLYSYKKNDLIVIKNKNLIDNFYNNPPDLQKRYDDKSQVLLEKETELINIGNQIPRSEYILKESIINDLKTELNNLETYQMIFKQMIDIKKEIKERIYEVKNSSELIKSPETKLGENQSPETKSGENQSPETESGENQSPETSLSTNNSSKNKINIENDSKIVKLKNKFSDLKNKLKKFEIDGKATKYENLFIDNLPKMEFHLNEKGIKDELGELVEQLGILKKLKRLVPLKIINKNIDKYLKPWQIYIITNLGYIFKNLIMKHILYLNNKDSEWIQKSNLKIDFEYQNNEFTGNLLMDKKRFMVFKKNSNQFKIIKLMKLREINFNPYRFLKLFLGEHNKVFYSLFAENWYKNPDKQIGILEFYGLLESLDDFRWDTQRLYNIFKLIDFKSDLVITDRKLTVIEKAKNKLVKATVTDGLFTGLSWFLSGGWWKDNWDMFEIYVGDTMSIYNFHKLYKNLIYEGINFIVSNYILTSQTYNSFNDEELLKERDKFVKNTSISIKIFDKKGKMHIKKGTLIENFLNYDAPIMKANLSEFVEGIFSGKLRSQIFLKIIYDLCLQFKLVPKVKSSLVELHDKNFEPELKFLKKYDKKFKTNIKININGREINEFKDVVRVRIDDIIPKINIIFTDQDQELIYKNRISLIDNHISLIKKEITDDEKEKNQNTTDIKRYINHEIKKNDFLPINLQDTDYDKIENINDLVKIVEKKINKQNKIIQKIEKENNIHYVSKIGRIGSL